jgi:hypothetical protein
VSRGDLLDAGHYAWEDAAAQRGSIALEWIEGGYQAAKASDLRTAGTSNTREPVG